MRRDARLEAWAVRPGEAAVEALIAALSELDREGVDGVFLGVGVGIDPGVARLAVLAAGIPPEVAVHLCSGADAGHAALHAAAHAMFSGYHQTVLAGAVAGTSRECWPPEGRTEDLDWRMSFPSEAEQGTHRIAQHALTAAEWFGRHGGETEGDLLAAHSVRPGAAAIRLSGAGNGPRIASLAAGGADPAGAGHAVALAGSRALHHVQLGVDVVDAAVISQVLPAEQAATAAALGLSPACIRDAPVASPAVGSLLSLPCLLEAIAASDGRHGLLLSGGVDGLGRATLLDTMPFA
ncbi:MAG: hypothetical protein VX265_06500 [Myxococcota bacterium]|nr:hypothetical protein [Myxococcota bacterium]